MPDLAQVEKWDGERARRWAEEVARCRQNVRLLREQQDRLREELARVRIELRAVEREYEAALSGDTERLPFVVEDPPAVEVSPAPAPPAPPAPMASVPLGPELCDILHPPKDGKKPRAQRRRKPKK